MADRLSTGIRVLDRRLGGGFPPGSVVAFCAPAASQGELFLHEVTAARETVYLTTSQTEDAVRNTLEASPSRITDVSIRYVAGDAPLENTRRLLRNVGDRWNLVIDPVDTLETVEPARYRNFLNGLKNEMTNTGSVAVLHCLAGAGTENRRVTRHMADAVFDLTVSTENSEIESELAVKKFRGGRAPRETIKLELSEGVQIDTSRDIA